jgi:arylsulfatase A-like enzyme
LAFFSGTLLLESTSRDWDLGVIESRLINSDVIARSGGRALGKFASALKLFAIIFGVSIVGCSESQVHSRPNLVLIVVDTLRADHLEIYGYERKTSPALKKLAERGVVYEQHVASAGQTVPSTLTLLTSLHPAEHGFRHLGNGHFSKHRPVYPDALTLLPEVLKEAGYATAGFVGNPFLQDENGFSQGYDRFLYSDADGARLTDAAIRWMDQHVSDGEPFFLYVHYFDVHTPYRPPGRFRELFPRPANGRVIESNGHVPGARKRDLRATVALYDGGIAYTDDQIGRLLASLDALGVVEETVVAVTSDHGEEFMDHGGFGHGTHVHGELVRAPLIIAGPGVRDPGRREAKLTQHLDLAPTLLTLAGVEAPAEFRGKPFAGNAAAAFAEDGPFYAVHADGYKLIVNIDSGEAQVFSLDDALDQHPLQEPDVELRLRERLAWYRALKSLYEEEANADVPGWSDAERAKLEALGYTR